jgi:crotonobetaine/carnitine-CoA ligase
MSRPALIRGAAWDRVPEELRGIHPSELTVANLLVRQASLHGEEPLVEGPGGKLTYEELISRVSGWAGSLRVAGVEAGDRVAIMAPNRNEVLELILACCWAGAVPVTVNTAARGAQLEHILENSTPSLLVADPACALVLAALETPAADVPIWLIDEAAAVGALPPRAIAAPGPGEPIEAAPAAPGDPAVIIYTSGTTGASKGVICHQAQMFWWGVNTGWNLGLTKGDVVHTCLPLFHTNALSAFFQALVFNARYSLEQRFSASGFWRSAAARGATVTFLLGAMVEILLARPEGPEDRGHDVRIALSPGTPADAHARFTERFGVTLLEAYGSTETNHVIGPVEGHRQAAGSMGWPLRGIRVRIVDEADNEVGPGEAGELLLRSSEPFSFAGGYYGMPEKTVEAWRNLWFHTGDRVVMAEDGSIRFLDRIKDAIRRRGENISSAEVEGAVCEHPEVDACAAFAVPSELGEDEVMVAVVRRDGSRLPAEDLVRSLEARLAYFAIPRYVEFVAGLPLTPNGKVRKAVLREHGVTDATWDADAAGYRAPRPVS